MIAPGPLAAVGTYINPGLGHRRPLWTAPIGAESSAIAGGARSARPALAEPDRTAQGKFGHGFGLLSWYQRVHLSVTTLALGNLVSSQLVQVRVWNGYLDRSVVVSAVDVAGGEGMTLDAPAPLPLTLATLEAQAWSLSVSVDGPPTIDATLTWTVTDEPSLTLHVTGSRVTAWGWTPDWADGVKERLSWLTDVLASPTGAEQRRKLRHWPVRTWSATVLVDGEDRSSMDLALYGWGQRNWALPVWTDVTWLASGVSAGDQSIALDTTHLDYRAGGLVLIRGETAQDLEVAEIQAVRADGLDLVRPVQLDWDPGCRVYPVRLAMLTEQPQLTRKTDDLVSAEVSFRSMEPCDWPAVPQATSYRGVPVLEEPAEWSDDLSAQYERLLSTLDNGINNPVTTDLVGTGIALQQHTWMLAGREERGGWRSLAYYLAGRWKAIWLPTFAADMRLVATTAATSSAFDVATIGYSRFAVGGKTGRRHIRIELRDGTLVYRRILGATGVDRTTERLSLDSAVGVELTPSNVLRISWLQLMRSADDDIEIDHTTDVDGVARASLMLRAVRDDLELPA